MVLFILPVQPHGGAKFFVHRWLIYKVGKHQQLHVNKYFP